MRIIAFSDTHGNTRAMREIFERNEKADAFIFLGDGERELDLMRKLYPHRKIMNVAGNCDFGSDAPETDLFVGEGVKIIFAHGHTYSVKLTTAKLYMKARQVQANVVLFGHTHCRYYQYDNGIHVLNPGSAGCPRDGRAPSYAFIDVTGSGILCSHVDL